MNNSVPRRAPSLEPLEYRLAPAGLGLTLPTIPGPLAALTGPEGLHLPALSLGLPSQAQSGLSLGVDAGILSPRAGLGSGEGLLSLGVKLDLALLPSVALQAGVGTPQALVTPGVQADPPALPPVLGSSPGGVLPAVNVPPVSLAASNLPVVSLPAVNVPPVNVPAASQLLPTVLPASPTPGATPSSAVSAPAVAPLPATPTGAVLAPDFGVTGLEEPAGTGDGPSASTLAAPRVNDATFASFSALPQTTPAPSASAQSEGDDIEEELFDLRDGRLLEDFGAAMASDEAALLSAPADDVFQAEGDNALALWLVGVLAGCAAGSAWLAARREREAVAVDADPFPLPLE